MNPHAKIAIRHSTCPHDCPSACALDVEVIDGRSIGRVRGSKRQTYSELLQRRHRQQGVPGDRQLHRFAVAPVVARPASSAPRSRAMPSASITLKD